MGEELSKALGLHIYQFSIFGYNIELADSAVIMSIITVFLIVAAALLTRRLETIPKGGQKIAEAIVELVNSIAKNNIGHHWKPFAPYLGTVLLLLVFANTISIFNIIPNGEQLHELTGLEFFKHWPEFSLRPPTKDINVTASLAVVTILVVLVGGLRIKKVGGWLKSFIEPVPVVLPFKILDYIIRPLSLCFRLFGNILGAFIVMELAYAALPILFPAALSIYFDLFDGGLQAYIFVFLTSLYIAEATE